MSHAVLISGGLDSAILLGEAVRVHDRVVPIFVRCGLTWEQVELTYLQRFLAAIKPSPAPLVTLDQPVADLYGRHWSITGENVPGEKDPDEMVFLPGRNVLLLAKSLLWCHMNAVPEIALGSLASNPFPDATPEFFRKMQEVVNQAVGGSVRVSLPLAGLKKKEVMRRGVSMPLQHTFSCIQPQGELHCGRCNKCGERRLAFREAGMADPTVYALP